MDSFNKVISFFLGLVVVIVFLAVITGRINLKNRSISTSTLTPTPIQKPLSTVKVETKINENNIYKTPPPKSIPASGLPTLLIPILLSGLVGGSFLRKAGKSK